MGTHHLATRYGNLKMRMFNTLRSRQNGRHFADDIFKCIFLNENVWNPIKISMKFVPKGPINNIPALVVQIMAWRRPGDKPLSEPMMVSLTTHICVTRPQWVNKYSNYPCADRIALKWEPQELTDDIGSNVNPLLGCHVKSQGVQVCSSFM